MTMHSRMKKKKPLKPTPESGSKGADLKKQKKVPIKVQTQFSRINRPGAKHTQKKHVAENQSDYENV